MHASLHGECINRFLNNLVLANNDSINSYVWQISRKNNITFKYTSLGIIISL